MSARRVFGDGRARAHLVCGYAPGVTPGRGGRDATERRPRHGPRGKASRPRPLGASTCSTNRQMQPIDTTSVLRIDELETRRDAQGVSSVLSIRDTRSTPHRPAPRDTCETHASGVTRPTAPTALDPHDTRTHTPDGARTHTMHRHTRPRLRRERIPRPSIHALQRSHHHDPCTCIDEEATREGRPS